MSMNNSSDTTGNRTRDLPAETRNSINKRTKPRCPTGGVKFYISCFKIGRSLYRKPNTATRGGIFRIVSSDQPHCRRAVIAPERRTKPLQTASVPGVSYLAHSLHVETEGAGISATLFTARSEVGLHR
jgi:hypothetical protein